MQCCLYGTLLQHGATHSKLLQAINFLYNIYAHLRFDSCIIFLLNLVHVFFSLLLLLLLLCWSVKKVTPKPDYYYLEVLDLNLNVCFWSTN